LRTRMSHNPLSVYLGLLKAKNLARKGESEQAMELYRAMLKRSPENKRAIEGLKSLERPAPDQEQVVLDSEPSQNQIDGLIALYNQEQLWPSSIPMCR